MVTPQEKTRLFIIMAAVEQIAKQSPEHHKDVLRVLKLLHKSLQPKEGELLPG